MRPRGGLPLFRIATLLCSWLMLAVGCNIAPTYVETSSEIDAFLAQNNFNAVCVGVKMERNDDLRRYTAMRLADYPDNEVANSCVCEALYKSGAGKWDRAVADGLKATKRDDLALCLAAAIDDPNIDDANLANLVRDLAGISTPAGYAAIAKITTTAQDSELRAAAVSSLRPSEPQRALLGDLLAEDKDPVVRAAAAEALRGVEDPAIVAKVLKAAVEDSDGLVRAAALRSVVKLRLPETDMMLCQAMLEDPDEVVRDTAVRAVKGTTRDRPLGCLNQRLKMKDESLTVRSSTLKALVASPSDKAALMLCDSVGPYLRMYAKDEAGWKEILQTTNIMEAQNNRDYERSYECVGKALRQGGYSCFARNYLGHWATDLGHKGVKAPRCPGMPAE